MISAWLGLGANVGDRGAAITEACRRLGTRLDDLRVSSMIETRAVDRDGAPDLAASSYLNAAAAGLFHGSPRELLSFLQEIEIEMGRAPEEKSLYLPRIIDLDILLLEAQGSLLSISEPDLVIPHPRLLSRPFCLGPLLELGLDARQRLTQTPIECSNSSR